MIQVQLSSKRWHKQLFIEKVLRFISREKSLSILSYATSKKAFREIIKELTELMEQLNELAIKTISLAGWVLILIEVLT